MAVELSESRRRIIMNSPHIVTPTAAGLHTFETDMSAPLKECRVNFSPVQAGTGDPAPDNVRSISGWTGFNLTRCGKNLFPCATGTDMVSMLPFKSSMRIMLYYNFPIGENFTVSARWTKAFSAGTNRRLYTGGKKTSGAFIGPSADGPVYKSFTNSPYETEEKYGQFDVTHNNRGLTYTDKDKEYAASLVDIQLELGSTATDYEPYNGVTIPLDWSSSAGTVYGGYVDLVRGVVVKEWQDINMSDISFIMSPSTGLFESSNLYAASKASGQVTLAFENYKAVANESGSPSQDKTAHFNTNGRYPYFRIKDSGYTTADDFKASLTGRKMLYKLATPVTYSIDPVTLKTLRGLNNIWSDANGNIELSYWTH